MSAFVTPLPVLSAPALYPPRSARRASRPACRPVASAAPPPPSSSSAADLLARLPPWAVRPATAPGVSASIAGSQWANFKLHLANWTGDWVYYDALTGARTKHMHSNRFLRLDDAPGKGTGTGTTAAGGGYETVTHTNTLHEQFPAVDAPMRAQSIHYSDTQPRPTWIQPIMRDGSLAPPLGGSCIFLPATGGSWSDGSLAEALFTERLVLHPHVPGVRFSVGARLAPDGVRSLFLVREEDVASRHDFLASKRGVYSRDMDAVRIVGRDDDDDEAGAGSRFAVVEHATTDGELVMGAEVFPAEAPPPLPVGPDRVALQLPDGIEVSLPATTGPTALGKPNAMHIRWEMDRGTWLHARTEFNATGQLVGDRTAIYYPI